MSEVIFLDFDGVIRIPQEAHILRVGSFKHAVRLRRSWSSAIIPFSTC